MIEIHSPLSPQDCLRRVQASFDAPLEPRPATASLGQSQHPGSRSFLAGTVEGDGFRVGFYGWTPAAASRALPDRAGRPIFAGRVEADGGGSVLIGGLDLRSRRNFYALWFGLVGFLFVVFDVSMLANLSRGASVAVPGMMSLFLGLGGLVFLRAERRMQRADATHIAGALNEAVAGDLNATYRPSTAAD